MVAQEPSRIRRAEAGTALAPSRPMRLGSCHRVPFLFACAVFAAGCYRAHDREVATRPTADAGVVRDTGRDVPPDAPVSACGPGLVALGALPPELVCGAAEDRVVFARLAQDLVAVAEGCHCAGTVSCDARITGERALSLETVLCENPSVDCDCFEERPVTTFNCPVPPLEPGTWTVSIDGREAFRLRADDRPEPPGPIAESNVCWRTSPRVDPVDRPCVGPSTDDLLVQSFCHDAEALAGTRVRIDVEGQHSCEHDRADCEVTVTADEIHVTPRIRACGEPCPTCELCAPIQHTCVTPPLSPGRYRIVSGDQISTIAVADDGVPRPGAECSHRE